MSDDGVLREVLDDLRGEARQRRVQLLAALAYVVLAAGLLYLFSSLGEDSGSFEDVHERTTLAAVGTGLSATGTLLCVVTAVVRHRTRPAPGREPATLPSRRGLATAGAIGVALVAAGLLALSRWT